jgi:hypothetical protein|tara:strand:- start:6008 stop:6652 length:645 start_codon:yes stop_codon:yes gene_type:complete
MKWIQILKNKIMGNQQNTSQFYVWIKSERSGEVVEVAEIQNDSKWTEFTDGTRCNANAIKEFLLPADDKDQAYLIAKDFGGIITSNPEAARPGRPRRDSEPEAARPVRPKRDVEKTAEINVMMEMLRKMSAKNHAEMPVKVNIPSKEVYDLFKDQMDITKKDLNSQIGLLVESQIDNLREQLKEQIESFIKNYYNGRTNNGNTTDTSSTESGNS